jgi:hypothetical protein
MTGVKEKSEGLSRGWAMYEKGIYAGLGNLQGIQ